MPTPLKNYYQILQVDPSAEQEVIEAAYKRLALKYHPDTNQSTDATERMKEINEAREVLKDPIKRAEYDRNRSAQPSNLHSNEKPNDEKFERNRSTKETSKTAHHRQTVANNQRGYKDLNSNLRLAIIIMTVLTTLIHLFLGITQVMGGMMGGVMFLLNAGGFAGLLALFMGWLPFKVPVLSDNKAYLHYAFMGFAAITIVAYFAVNGGASFANPIGLFTKVDELVIIGALWMHLQAKA